MPYSKGKIPQSNQIHHLKQLLITQLGCLRQAVLQKRAYLMSLWRSISLTLAHLNRLKWRGVVIGGLLSGSLAYPSSSQAVEIPFSKKLIINEVFKGANDLQAFDVDGDGDLDMVGAGGTADEITWWENTTGDGSVWNEYNIASNFDGAASIHAADIDRDGDMDVLGAANLADEISWWENTIGDGSVWNEQNIASNFDGATHIQAVDVDNDGDLDVLGAANVANDISWWENTAGDGSVWNEQNIANNFEGANSIRAADIDRDGDIDILGAANIANKVTWWENTTGDGSTWNEQNIASFNGANSIHATDIDRDGDLDVLGAANGTDQITWWENATGNGSSWNEHNLNEAYATHLHPSDMDNDGDWDIIGVDDKNKEVAWWENIDTQGQSWTKHTLDNNFPGKNISAADVDGDGDFDILGAAYDSDEIAWWRNDTIHRSAFYPHIKFPGMGKVPIDSNFTGAYSAYVADLDRDGDLDVLGAAYGADSISWWKNTAGDGSAWLKQNIDTNFSGATDTYAVDIDGDGDQDVLGTAFGGNEVAWWENNGNGSIWTKQSIKTGFSGAYAVHATDLDQDGDFDVISTAHSTDQITWWENQDGIGQSWIEHNITSDFEGATSIYSADIDNDGDQDILGAASIANEIAWWSNLNGSWSKQSIETNFDGAYSVHAADIDQDGDLDVLGAAYDTNDIVWWENTGSSPWARHEIETDLKGANSVQAADLDDDGDLDILGAGITSDTLTWWENKAGSWRRQNIDILFDGANSILAADMDQDGDLDILGTAFAAHDIIWWENRGGQFALSTLNTAPLYLANGQQDDIFKIQMFHRGRTGDHIEELVTLRLSIQNNLGTPLTDPQANALIENLYIYRDSGSGSFEVGTDSLITTLDTLSLLNGEVTITFPDGQSQLQADVDTPATYFVVVQLAPNATEQAVHQFRMVHIVEGDQRSSAEDIINDQSLSLEFTQNVPSIIVTARILITNSYLPLILQEILTAPDLIIDRLVVTSNDIIVVIKNQGQTAVTDAFWVDLYLNPTLPPTGVNQIWLERGEQGLVWGLDIPNNLGIPIGANEVVTLTLSSPYYRADLSRFVTPIPPGIPVYAQVDSVNRSVDNNTTGAVLEEHEIQGGPYNNITHTLTITGLSTTASTTTTLDNHASPDSGERQLPRRRRPDE